MFGSTAVTAIELEAERRRELLSGGASLGVQAAWAADGSEPGFESSTQTATGGGFAGIGAIVVAWARALGLTAQRA
jgi:hypothetical protein